LEDDDQKMPEREKGQKKGIFAVAPEKMENAAFFSPFSFSGGAGGSKRDVFQHPPLPKSPWL
jgi:hypothetical protein